MPPPHNGVKEGLTILVSDALSLSTQGTVRGVPELTSDYVLEE